jgi:hypothetical protein
MAWRRGHRGRPRKANPRHRATTRPDLEVNAVGALYGRGHLDAQQYDVLSTVTLWLERLARGWAGVGGVTGLWYSIVGAATPAGYIRPMNDVTSGLADGARRQLVKALQRLDGSRALIVALCEGHTPPLVLHVLEGKITPADEAELTKLRLGLDHLAGRRQRA